MPAPKNWRVCSIWALSWIAEQKGFSQGERMKTALARALVHDPANIVLDEPTNGLDVLATRALRETLRHLGLARWGASALSFHPHHARGAATVRPRGRHGAWQECGPGHCGCTHGADRTHQFEDCFVQLAFGTDNTQGASQ